MSAHQHGQAVRPVLGCLVLGRRGVGTLRLVSIPVGVGISSRAVCHGLCTGPTFQICPSGAGVVWRLGNSVGDSHGVLVLILDRLRSRHVGDPILESNITRRVDFALFMVAALENDELIHEAPAIVGCRTPSALADAADIAPSTGH